MYLHPLEWYLRLTPGRDTMEWFSEDRLLDFSGWELRKTLNLFAICNPAFNERLGSPVIYREESVLAQTLRTLFPTYFQPLKAFHHYFSVADKMRASHPFNESIGVKAYFYIIRPLLACRFILKHHVQPPTLFSELINQVDLPQEIQDRLTELVEQKKTTNEKASISIPAPFIEFTQQLHTDMAALRFEGLSTLLPETSPSDRTPLENLFKQLVFRSRP